MGGGGAGRKPASPMMRNSRQIELVQARLRCIVGMRRGQANAGQFGFQLIAARTRICIHGMHFKKIIELPIKKPKSGRRKRRGADRRRARQYRGRCRREA